MNIIVCVKQVARIYVQNGYDPVTGAVVGDGLVYILNPYDENAVEEALRQKERAGRGRITVITFGDSRAEEVLRRCLAMGADEAVHVLDQDPGGRDPWRTAAVLAGVIKTREYDLLLFGKKAIDDEMGQVGTFVAELLNLPLVTSVTAVDLTGGTGARVQRALDRGNREEVACSLPAVLTVDRMLNHPRYPTLPARQAARAKTIERVDPRAVDVFPVPPKMAIVRLGPPKLRPKKILAPDSNMSEADRMKFIMTGGLGDKKGGSVGGDPEQVASSIIEFLKEKRVIPN